MKSRKDLETAEFILEQFASSSGGEGNDFAWENPGRGGFRDTERSLGADWLRARGENWDDHGDKIVLASYEFNAAKNEYQRTPQYRSYIRGLRSKRAAFGICYDCPLPAKEGRRRCARCCAKMVERSWAHQSRRLAEKSAAGICHSCPSAAVDGKNRCKPCLAKDSARSRAYQQKRKERKAA